MARCQSVVEREKEGNTHNAASRIIRVDDAQEELSAYEKMQGQQMTALQAARYAPGS